MTWKTCRISAAVMAMAMALASGGTARAGFVVNITQAGGNVLVNGSGTLDLTNLTYLGTASTGSGGLFPFSGQIDIHAPADRTTEDVYSGVQGPTAFGFGSTSAGGSPASGSVGSSSEAGLINNSSTPGTSFLLVYQGYTSGATIVDSMTFLGQTFNSLGLTAGTYHHTWGTGAYADSFTINVGAVPEPASLLMTGGALGFVALVGRCRRKAKLKPGLASV